MADMNTNGLSVGEEQAQEFLAQYVNQAVKGERDRVDNKLDSDYYTKADIETALSYKCDKSDFNALTGRVTTLEDKPVVLDTDYATDTKAGVIKVGGGLDIDSNGVLSVDIGSGLGISQNTVFVNTGNGLKIAGGKVAIADKVITTDNIAEYQEVDGEGLEEVINNHIEDKCYTKQDSYNKTEVNTALADKASAQDVAYLERYLALLDVPDISYGVYTGNGTVNREIYLGYRPKAVLVVSIYGFSVEVGSVYENRGGFALDGYPSGCGITITQNGFSVSGDCNNNSETYYYITIQNNNSIVVHQ